MTKMKELNKQGGRSIGGNHYLYEKIRTKSILLKHILNEMAIRKFFHLLLAFWRSDSIIEPEAMIELFN